MFIQEAWAQGAPAAGGGGADLLTSLLPMVLIFVVFYFLLIRPQQKKLKAHRQLVSELKRGDRVVTNGGLMGTVAQVVNEGEIVIEIAEGVKVHVARNAVSDVLNRSAGGDKADKAGK